LGESRGDPREGSSAQNSLTLEMKENERGKRQKGERGGVDVSQAYPWKDGKETKKKGGKGTEDAERSSFWGGTLKGGKRDYRGENNEGVGKENRGLRT